MSDQTPDPWAPPVHPTPWIAPAGQAPWSPPGPPPRKRRTRVLVAGAVALAVAVAGTGVVLLGRELASGLEDLERESGSGRGGAAGSSASIGEVRAGDCFNVPGGRLEGPTPRVFTVACAEPHDAEVTAVLDEPRRPYPGKDVLDERSGDRCWQAQDRYAMDAWALPAYAQSHYFAPSREGWRAGDRRTVCVIATTGTEHRGSVRQPEERFTPDQRAFLGPVNRVEFVLADQPEPEPEQAPAAYRDWARRVDGALAVEERALGGLTGRSELRRAAAAQLEAVRESRRAWALAARAKGTTAFEEQWDAGLSALSVEAERGLRRELGLSDRVPEWLQEFEDGRGGSEGGSGGGSGGGPGGGPGDGPARESA
ncbi:septum formation family protein [Streptomyces sp. NPDC089799]|uniref:septum formation family protein n=1 Tax=Streptomyces sp. NPDC089799 TaxID=3155066 RepID=UPI00343DA382